MFYDGNFKIFLIILPVALEKREKAHFNAANERRHQKLYLAVYPDISGYLSVFICFFFTEARERRL